MKLTEQEKITIKTYDKIAAEWSKKHHIHDYWKEELKLFKKFLPIGKIIDIGCGGGRDAKPLSNLGYKYLGTDISTGLLKEAKKNNPGIKFIYKNLYKPSFKSNTFDGFWASAIFLHIPKDRINLILQRNWIKQGGVGFISVKEGGGEVLDNSDIEGPVRFWSYYKLSEFRKLLMSNKFKILKNYRKKVIESTIWLIYFVEVTK